MKIQIMNNLKLAQEAIIIERNILREPGGIQDQYHCAIGGLRFYDFMNHETEISQDYSSSYFGDYLNDRIYLYWAGDERLSSYSHPITNRKNHIEFKMELCKIAKKFRSEFSHDDAATTYSLLAESIKISWKIKQEIIGAEENSPFSAQIDNIIQSGADAAKLCGAGGGGFILILASPEKWPLVRARLKRDHIYNIKVTAHGSTVKGL